MASDILSKFNKERKEFVKIFENKLIKYAIDLVYLTYDIEILIQNHNIELLKHETIQKMVNIRTIWLEILAGNHTEENPN